MVRDEDDIDAEEAGKNANMLQVKQLISNNVIIKRKEQLHRWQSSEMNGEPVLRRKKPRVQFQDSDIFLSACMSGDEDEVEDLLEKGADINTSTVDGLTALHQSVIDSKPEMVRFLCEKGADVNAQDNEGWTPLHAAACCGNLAIVKYLCQNGADMAIINSDKELALDLADDESCREYLDYEYKRQSIDPNQCRNVELTTMMRDAQKWLRDGRYNDVPHSRTGASALHVAAAKGYIQLLELLLDAGGSPKSQDKDGWTPLHAAAHWAEKDACKILIENGASIHDLNHAGQNVLTVADNQVVEYLEDLERTVDRKRIATSPPVTSVLQEKNVRIGDDQNGNEYKREYREASSENESLYTSPKCPKLSEKTPSVDSQSSQESRRSASVDDETSLEKSESEIPTSARTSEEPSLSLSERSSASIEKLSENISQRSSVTSNNTLGSSTTGASSMSTGSTRTTSNSSSLQSGDQHISCTVPFPRPLQQPNSWINRGVQLVTRSASTSSGSGSRTTDGSQSGSSQVSVTSPSASTSPAPAYASNSNVSQNKTLPWLSNTVNESEAERRTTARLQRQNRRSTQGVTKEQLEEASRIAAEESVRRRNSSNTNSSVGSSETSHRDCMLVRLASEERDSTSISESSEPQTSSTVRILQDGSVQDMERSSTDRSSPHTTSASIYLYKNNSIPNNSNTPSSTGLRRKSQGAPLSRSNRRGTGPVLPEDLHAAVASVSISSPAEPAPMPTTPAPAPPPPLRYATNNGATFSRPVITPFSRPEARLNTSGTYSSTSSTTDRTSGLESKSSSLPPTLITPSSTTTSSGLRSAVVPPSPSSRYPSKAAAVSPLHSSQSSYTPASNSYGSRPTETNLNYKALYEKEKLESDRLRKELEDMKKQDNSLSIGRTATSRFRNGSPASSIPLSKSSSGASMDDSERRSMERKISDLELQVKTVSQLRIENQRLKEENGALVRVISKMTI
ncbi:unnamed protein product [Auanema sp. JU1783]|nr:unnamed protein product [Auanema sp. JU1783]